MIIKTGKGSIKSNIDGMLITDGESYGVEIFLGENRTADEYDEITAQEYEKVTKDDFLL